MLPQNLYSEDNYQETYYPHKPFSGGALQLNSEYAEFQWARSSIQKGNERKRNNGSARNSNRCRDMLDKYRSFKIHAQKIDARGPDKAKGKPCQR